MPKQAIEGMQVQGVTKLSEALAAFE
jgi:hypothetical protein